MNNVNNYRSYAEFDNHFLVQPISAPGVGLEGYICIHKKRTVHPSLGATRLWKYDTKEEALRDALRLSRLMSFKSALAGLPYGGAKAALIMPPGGLNGNRVDFFKAYAEEVNKLNGKFVTGTDVGVADQDLSIMRQVTQNVIGESIDSGYYTAWGIYYCLEVLFSALYGSAAFSGRSFAIQGLGKTGMSLLKLLADNGARIIYVADINQAVVKEAEEKYPFIKPVKHDEIHKQAVDVYCPCALGGALNLTTVNELHCKSIVGSANNQLADPQIGLMLYRKKIIYAPDYLVNAGGIISVVDEYEYKKDSNIDRIKQKIKKIPVMFSQILQKSIAEDRPPHQIADEIANWTINMTT